MFVGPALRRPSRQLQRACFGLGKCLGIHERYVRVRDSLRTASRLRSPVPEVTAASRPTVTLYADPAFRSSAGIEQYTRQLIQGLPYRSKAWQLQLVVTRSDYLAAIEELLRGADRQSRPDVQLLRGGGRLRRYTWTILGRPVVRSTNGRKSALSHSPLHVRLPVDGHAVVTAHDLHAIADPALVARREKLRLQPQLEARALRTADHLIAISRYTRDQVVDRLGRRRADISVVPHGVDHQRFHPRPPHETRPVLEARGLPPRYLLYVGSLYSRKLGRLLEGYGILRTQLADAPPLVIVGGRESTVSGERPLDQRLEAMGLQDNVIRLGVVPDEELPVILAAATVFVYVSLYEGFGMSVLEAMASGLPVVASNRTALPELVDEAAVTVDPRDPSAISSALRRLLSGREEAERLGSNAAKLAASFSWERTVYETTRVYERLLRLA